MQLSQRAMFQHLKQILELHFPSLALGLLFPFFFATVIILELLFQSHI